MILAYPVLAPDVPGVAVPVFLVVVVAGVASASGPMLAKRITVVPTPLRP